MGAVLYNEVSQTNSNINGEWRILTRRELLAVYENWFLKYSRLLDRNIVTFGVIAFLGFLRLTA